ncbi:hypothetical protein IM660_18725 [Ruania alkalisoli]|uniref:Solute-binding protein family 5 domain-containing protein n=1 Tax=Ruania alkalisoli TaxID=2779775 RepID=A0A7M1SSQ4_9MICO|nr:ABC transporter substrate-binding protein [Ruania alkalisoli]QOR70589.1 hypothetical protein IM660_18725 [Ruania alkalisoli]
MISTVSNQSRRRRALRTALATAAAACLTLTACGTDTADDGGTSPVAAEQSIRFGFSSEPPPMSTTGGTASTVSYQLYGLVHRGVMMYGPDGDVIPALAESVQEVDPVTYEIALRPDLTFQDGTPITADNVQTALLHYADPANSARSYAGMQYVESVDSDGDRLATVHLSSPNSSFLEYLADPSAFIAPAEAYQADAEATIGAGPFQLESWDEGVGLTLTKYDGYDDAAAVDLDQVDVTFYPDATARVNALLSGDLDFIDYVPWESYEQISSTEGYQLDGAVGVFQSVLFNVQDGPFSDPLLRQAVAYAVNRDNSVEAGFFGHGEPLYGVPGTGRAGENLWSDDPDRARELLAEAGYDEGELTVHLLSNSTYVFLQDLGLSVQSDLEAVGFNVEFTSPDWATFTEEAVAGNYDLIVQGNIGNVQDPAAWLPVLVQPPPAANTSFGYQNDELDQALADALAATSAEEKDDALARAYAIIADDVPFASLNQRMQSYALSENVQGFTVMPGFAQPYSVNNFVDVTMATE